jgi:hypothetical protein
LLKVKLKPKGDRKMTKKEMKEFYKQERENKQFEKRLRIKSQAVKMTRTILG